MSVPSTPARPRRGTRTGSRVAFTAGRVAFTASRVAVVVLALLGLFATAATAAAAPAYPPTGCRSTAAGTGAACHETSGVAVHLPSSPRPAHRPAVDHPDSNASSLAFTGFPDIITVFLAVVLLGGGSLLLLLGRRRRS